jgi:hypothetical protein
MGHRAWVLVSLGALAVGAWTVGASRSQRPAPLRFACWYWHQPFRLTPDERQQMVAARIERLYVYAGTLVARDGALRLTRLQQWTSPPPGELFAVIRVHPRAIGSLLGPAGAAQAAALMRRARLPRAVRGVQWDVDVPTSRLGDYARFLRGLRRGLPPGRALSVTALPDWLRSREYRAVCEAVDEVAPQFYGNYWPEAGQRPPALWETRDLLTAVRRSAGGRARVWMGLPAYGRCVVMDARARPVGVRHDLDPEAPLDDPAWEVEARDTRWERWTGEDGPSPVEDTLGLRCRESAAAGPMEAPPGTRLWFQWPRADGLQAAVAAIRAMSVPGVEGICLFRWPAPGEPLAFPISSIAGAVAAGAPVDPSARLEVRFARAGRTVNVSVLNSGIACPILDGGITVELLAPRGAEVLADGPVEWQWANQPASPLRGDRAVFARPLLRSGSRWEVCRVIRCPGPVQTKVRWQGLDGRWQTATTWEPESGETVGGTP